VAVPVDRFCGVRAGFAARERFAGAEASASTAAADARPVIAARLVDDWLIGAGARYAPRP
jgi:hypothetical protein